MKNFIFFWKKIRNGKQKENFICLVIWKYFLFVLVKMRDFQSFSLARICDAVEIWERRAIFFSNNLQCWMIFFFLKIINIYKKFILKNKLCKNNFDSYVRVVVCEFRGYVWFDKNNLRMLINIFFLKTKSCILRFTYFFLK